jgi:hypothetical protein
MTFLSSIELGDFKNIYPRSMALLKKKLHFFGQADLGGLREHSMAIWGCIMRTKFVSSTYYTFKVGF